MQSMQMLYVRLVMVVAALPSIGAAQTMLGSRCDTLQAVSGQQAITLSQPVAANQWIIVSAAANSTFVQFASNEVTDSVGNAYPIYDVTLLAASSGALATFAGRVVTALNANDQITVAYSDNGSTTTQSCVEVAAFPGVLALTNPSDAFGESSGNGTAESVTTGTPTQFGSELVYSAFASAQTPGTMVAVAPAQALGEVCSGDSTLCVLPAWNLGATSAGTMEAAGVGTGNSVSWGALVITFQSNDRIFADGFE